MVDWLRPRDPGFSALRRACRTAILMPALFAVGIHLFGSTQVALFAAFGALATMMLVDFGGPMQERLQSMASLAVGGAVMITLGTLTSVNAWLAAAAMLVVGFAILFAGCVSSVLVAASFALLLSFILPVCLPGSAADIPARLAGWGMSAAVAVMAIAVLWPAPENGLLRDRVRRACEALAECLECEAAHLQRGPENPSPAERNACFDRARAAVSDLRSFFLASSSRPTDLTTQGRLLVRMVDELAWLDAVLRTDQELPTGEVADAVAEVRAAAAAVLDRSARLLSERGASTDELAAALEALEAGQRGLEDKVLREFPHAPQALELTTALAPSFRTREVGYAASLVGTNVTGVLLAERRSWWERLLGREPEGVLTPWRAARERAATHWRPRSVWMHNSVRGAIALALAVWVANESGLQHAFWVVLGTLSVLRSNALNTGQLVIRGIAGTILGFIVAAGILVAVGTDARLLWAVLPLAVFGAGLAPAAISFAAGQAAFTITLVVLFNILEPAGWKVGLVRVEDVAIGCAISLIVGLLFWPRGAAAALRRELADAYAVCAGYVDEAVELGLRPPGDGAAQPAEAGRTRAAAAARRLDDAFRTYLCERAAKPVPVAAVARLVSGVTALRVNGGALIELWRGGDAGPSGAGAARDELRRASRRLRDWYGELARGIDSPAAIPEPLEGDDAAAARLLESLHRHLGGDQAPAGPAVVHLIWTADHLDALRRLQVTLVDPARRAAGVR